MSDFHARERDRRSNKEAARLLRGLKEEVDRVKERGEEAGSITLSRRARETMGADDEVVVTERDSRDMQWLEGTWGFDEWASSPHLLDSFDDGSTRFPDIWEGSLSMWERATTPVTHGSHALVSSDTGTSSAVIRTFPESSSGTYPITPEPGDIILWSAYVLDPNTQFEFRIAQHYTGTYNQFYDFAFDTGTGVFQIRRREADAWNPVASDSASTALRDGVWYHHVLAWGTDGSFAWEFSADDEATVHSLAGSDATFTHGGFGLGRSTSATAPNRIAIDGLRIIRRAW